MAQREQKSLYASGFENLGRSSDVASKLDMLINSMGPIESRILLEILSHCNKKLLLTCEQTSRFLNIRSRKVEELASSGKLTRNRNGYFQVGDVYKFKLKKIRMEMQGLVEMSDIENSIGS